MKCPFCNYEDTKVVESRCAGHRVRRRRECENCLKRFTTYEVIEDVPIIVIKKDKSREVFDRNKILKGMLRACEKRSVTINELETAISEIEATLQSAIDREVTSSRIGELIMEKLKNISWISAFLSGRMHRGTFTKRVQTCREGRTLYMSYYKS